MNILTCCLMKLAWQQAIAVRSNRAVAVQPKPHTRITKMYQHHHHRVAPQDAMWHLLPAECLMRGEMRIVELLMRRGVSTLYSQHVTKQVFNRASLECPAKQH
mmetsp:Transcript_119506/g.217165  ORF Transcript_119506/g.217165 Transcript_119506/m.217165 type:complete len:103 (-) Transcript_119506:133-441(-)